MRSLAFLFFVVIFSSKATAIGHGGLGVFLNPSKPDCDSTLLDDVFEESLGHFGFGPGKGPAVENSRVATAPALPVLPAATVIEIKEQLAEELRKATGDLEEILSENVQPVDGAAHAEKLKKFEALFVELNKRFLERGPLIELFRRVFLSEGSILILGGTGNGKSATVDAVGKNVVDANGNTSYFSLQISQDTTASETQGGLIVEEGLKGKMLRLWEEGILGAKIVFLDEFFDGRLKFLRSFLKAFNERVYTQGLLQVKGKMKYFFAASNKYINQIYEMYGNNDPQALINRFDHVYYAQGVLKNLSSILSLAKQRTKTGIAAPTFEELESLHEFTRSVPMPLLEVVRTQAIFHALRKRLMSREAVELAAYREKINRRELVQPPYKTTRIFSIGSLVKAFEMARVEAVLRFSKQPDPGPLVVKKDDVVDAMKAFLIMQGPEGLELEQSLAAARNDVYETSQLSNLKLEQAELADVLREIDVAETTRVDSLRELIKMIEVARAPDELREKAALLLQIVHEMNGHLAHLDDAERIGPDQIAALAGMKLLRAHPEVLELIK